MVPPCLSMICLVTQKASHSTRRSDDPPYCEGHGNRATLYINYEKCSNDATVVVLEWTCQMHFVVVLF
jgi:hypothetical protein